MDDFAPAPAQRAFDNVGRTREEPFAGRKKAAKKVPAGDGKKPCHGPEPPAEAEPDPDLDHQLDLLA